MSSTETRDTVAVVRPAGRITALNADDFRKELQSLVDRGSIHLRIDLAGVDIIDSKGLAVFIVCHQTVAPLGGSLTVVTDNDDLRRLFRVMRLDQHFTVCGSKDAAAMVQPVAT